MSLRDRPVCNIRYCHRNPASWILAGFALLEQDGVLQIGRVETFDRFLQNDLYPHNNIVEVEIDGNIVVFDYENGYRSFLRPSLFDDQIEHIKAYFKANYDPAKYDGLRNCGKVYPFAAGTFTATCPGNPFDQVRLKEFGLSLSGVKQYASNLRRRAAYLDEYDYRKVECADSFSDYSILYWSMLAPIYTNKKKMAEVYSFLTDEQVDALAKRALEEQKEINRRRIVICAALKKEYGSLLIGGIADNEFARQNVPDLITHDERVTTRKRFIETMHTGVIGVVSVGHQFCIGARFGELLSSGRAILSDPLRYVLPGDCAEGQNYLSFRNGGELCERVEFLLHNPEVIHEMEAQNRKYYADCFNPRACVRNALHTAFPAHEGFQNEKGGAV